MTKESLKAGDRVAVYGKTFNLHPIRVLATVEKNLGNGLVRLVETNQTYGSSKDPYDKWDLTLVHRTQLRRLRPKKKPMSVEADVEWKRCTCGNLVAPVGLDRGALEGKRGTLVFTEEVKNG